MHEFKQTIRSQSFQNGIKTVAAFIVVGLLGASITTAFPQHYAKPYREKPATTSPVESTSNHAFVQNNPTEFDPQPPVNPATSLQPPSESTKKVANNQIVKTTATAHTIEPIQLPNLAMMPPITGNTPIVNPITLPPISINIDPVQPTLPITMVVIGPPPSSPQYTNWRNLINYIIDHPGISLSTDDIVKLLQS